MTLIQLQTPPPHSIKQCFIHTRTIIIHSLHLQAALLCKATIPHNTSGKEREPINETLIEQSFQKQTLT